MHVVCIRTGGEISRFYCFVSYGVWKYLDLFKLGFGDRFRCSSAAVFVLGAGWLRAVIGFWLLGFFVVFLLCS